MQKHNRNLPLIAIHNEPRRLVRRVIINHARHIHTLATALTAPHLALRDLLLIRHNPARVSANFRVPAHDRLAEIRFVFIKITPLLQERGRGEVARAHNRFRIRQSLPSPRPVGQGH